MVDPTDVSVREGQDGNGIGDRAIHSSGMEPLLTSSQSMSENRVLREGRRSEEECQQLCTTRFGEVRLLLENIVAAQEGQRNLRERESAGSHFSFCFIDIDPHLIYIAESAASKEEIIEEIRRAREGMMEEIQSFFRGTSKMDGDGTFST